MTSLKRENYSSSNVRICEPYPLTRTMVVKSADAGINLLDYLKQRFPYISTEEWQNRIERNWIWLDNGTASPGAILTSKQIIYHHSPAVREPAVPDLVSIVEEHDDWLISYKPAPMPMHQGGRYYKNTLTYILAEMGYENLHVVHRLDSVTSGLVLFAKTKAMANRLQKAFKNQTVKKWYAARVKGKPSFEKLLISSYIRRKQGFVFESGKNLPGGKPAQTLIEPVALLGNSTIVKCYPKTGRTHQIRLHLQEAGLPIIDDPIYGPDGDTSGSSLQNRAVSLQSSGIEIEELSIHSEIGIPPKWKQPFDIHSSIN